MNIKSTKRYFYSFYFLCNSVGIKNISSNLRQRSGRIPQLPFEAARKRTRFVDFRNQCQTDRFSYQRQFKMILSFKFLLKE